MKHIYKESTITELVGTLDINMENDMVVIVDGGKDAPPMEYDIVGLLEANKGKQISLKLIDEKVI